MISCVEVWDVNLMVGCALFSLVRRALSESGVSCQMHSMSSM